MHTGFAVIALAMGLGAMAPAAAGASELAFMAGQWCRGDDHDGVQESWFTPLGGESVGMGRTLAGGQQVAFEYLRIARVDGVTTYFAQPGGREAVTFTRTDGGEGWVRFENPAHDFPQAIAYRRAGAGLTATISGPGPGGETSSMSIEYRPCGEG